MTTIVTVNAIVMNNDLADVNGSRWYVTEMDGWDSPTIRQSSLELPSKHGQVTTEGLYGSRNVTIKGVCKAVSEAAFFTSRYYLASQTNFLKRTTFLFSVGEDITRRMNVVRNGELRMPYIGVGSFEFELLVRGDDPFKYADTLSSEAFNANIAEVIVNAGTAVTYPTITMNATGTPVITCGALTWSAASSIPSGTVIDMKAQTLLNGTTSYFDAYNTTSQWLSLQPGNNTVQSTVPMTVTWRGAWA